jgi:hypothetical protein
MTWRGTFTSALRRHMYYRDIVKDDWPWPQRILGMRYIQMTVGLVKCGLPCNAHRLGYPNDIAKLNG